MDISQALELNTHHLAKLLHVRSQAQVLPRPHIKASSIRRIVQKGKAVLSSLTLIQLELWNHNFLRYNQPTVAPLNIKVFQPSHSKTGRNVLKLCESAVGLRSTSHHQPREKNPDRNGDPTK